MFKKWSLEMSESLPIVNIVIAVILVVVALIALLLWRKQKGKLEQPIVRNKKAFFAQWIIGLILALVAAFFMFDGDILGENTTGIATVIGIVGIGLIATSNITLLSSKHK
jgi:tellurite resistance protein TehA-like permease